MTGQPDPPETDIDSDMHVVQGLWQASKELAEAVIAPDELVEWRAYEFAAATLLDTHETLCAVARAAHDARIATEMHTSLAAAHDALVTADREWREWDSGAIRIHLTHALRLLGDARHARLPYRAA